MPLTLPIIMRLQTQSRDAVSGNLEFEDYGNILLESNDAAIAVEPGDTTYVFNKWGVRFNATPARAGVNLIQFYDVNGQIYLVDWTNSGFAVYSTVDKTGSVGAVRVCGGIVTGSAGAVVVDDTYVHDLTSGQNNNDYLFYRRYFKTTYFSDVATTINAGNNTARILTSSGGRQVSARSAIPLPNGGLMFVGSCYPSAGTTAPIVARLEFSSGQVSVPAAYRYGSSGTTFGYLNFNSITAGPDSDVLVGGSFVSGNLVPMLVKTDTALAARTYYAGFYFGANATVRRVLYGDGYYYALIQYVSGLAVMKLDPALRIVWTVLIGNIDTFVAALNVDTYGLVRHPTGRLFVSFSGNALGGIGQNVVAIDEDGRLVWSRVCGIFGQFTFMPAITLDPSDNAILIGGVITSTNNPAIMRLSYDGNFIRTNSGSPDFRVYGTSATLTSLPASLSIVSGSESLIALTIAPTTQSLSVSTNTGLSRRDL
jgi:hypothetical protein